MVVITSPDMLLTAPEAAEVAGVRITRIRTWDRRGHLERAGLNERGWPVYKALDVAKCKHRFAEYDRAGAAALARGRRGTMASLTVLLSAGEPETGGWCDTCLLPSRIRVPVTMITEAGASDTAIPPVDVCAECGRRYRD